MRRVLFVGDVNVDIIMGGLESLPVVDREITCSSYRLAMGSSAAISACAYAALGGKAHLAGLAGDDDNGRFMLSGLGARGVDTELVRLSDDTVTGVTVNLIHESTRTQVTFPGAIERFDASDLTPEVLGRFDHVHFAGIYLQTSLRPRLEGLLGASRDAGATTSLDPQWDPAERWEGIERWLPLLDYLFVNRDEGCSIAGAETPRQAAVVLGARCGVAVVKSGEDGAYASDGSETVHVPAPRIRLVDPTGAGDCFDAAFLYAVIERGDDLAGECRLAVGVASASCTATGGVVEADILRGALS